jgi:hypothetical protein
MSDRTAAAKARVAQAWADLGDDDTPDWRTAKPWRGQAGWGVGIDHTGAFWTNMGRGWYGPYETEAEAQALLDAETAE